MLFFLLLPLFSVTQLHAQQDDVCKQCGDDEAIQDCEGAAFQMLFVRNLMDGQVNASFHVLNYFEPPTSSVWTLFEQDLNGNYQVIGSGQGYNVDFDFTPTMYNQDGQACFKILHCYFDGERPIYCCRNFCFKKPTEEFCCELKYEFSGTHSPTWDLGDGTVLSTTITPVVHTYTDVNTYQVNPIPVRLLSASGYPFGAQIAFALPINKPVKAPDGIWIGEDCENRDISLLRNKLDPTRLIFEGSSISTANISVKGNMIDSKNYTFSRCDFCMHPDSRMTVATEAVGLDRTHMHDKGCTENDAWFGLVLEYNGVPRLNAINGTHIEGAYNAVKTSSANNILSLQSCRLDRNYVGIYVARPTIFTKFGGNTFGNPFRVLEWPGGGLGCGGYAIPKPQHPQPYAGIYADAENLVNLPIWGSPNTFANICNGIYLDNANGDRIQNCKFSNMTFGYYQDANGFDDGRGIYMNALGNPKSLNQIGLGKAGQSTFANCRTGIQVSFAGGAVSLNIEGNKMNNVGEGISVGSDSEIGRFQALSLIKENDINYVKEYTDPNSNAVWSSSHGIYIGGANKGFLLIRNNRIVTDYANNVGVGIQIANVGNNSAGWPITIRDHNTNGDGIFGGMRGIASRNSRGVLVRKNIVDNDLQAGIQIQSTTNAHVMCNEVTGVHNYFSRGLWGDMDNGQVTWEYNTTDGHTNGLHGQMSAPPVTVLCNNFGDHHRGIYESDNADFGDQGTQAISNGNRWMGTYSDLHARAINPGEKYYVTNQELPNIQINTNPAGWFSLASTNGVCLNGCPTSPTAVSNSGNEAARLKTASGEVIEGLAGYLAERTLYGDLLSDASLIDEDAVFTAFIDRNQATAVGKISSLVYQIEQSAAYTDLEESLIAQNEPIYQDILEQLIQLDQALQDGADIADQLVEREALLAKKADIEAEMMQLYRDNLERRKNAYPNLMKDLTEISGTEVYHTNELEFFGVYLRSAFTFTSVNESDTEALRRLAEQCEYEGGSVVLTARAWYNALTQSTIQSPCKDAQDRSFVQSDVKSTSADLLKVSPNPAKNWIGLEWETVKDTEWMLSIYDIAGNLVSTKTIAANQASIKLDISTYKVGQYFAQLSSLDRTIQKKIAFSVQR